VHNQPEKKVTAMKQTVREPSPTRAWALVSIVPILILIGLMPAAHCQTYPAKPVRIVIGFPPGGGTDKLARLISPKLTASLGQSVIVENRPGAGGVVGAEVVAKAVPDGHTMLVTTSAYTISAALQDRLPYDPLTGLAPVTMFAISPSIVVVHPSLPVRNIKELIAFAKARPGRLNYGSSGNGAPYHIATEMFKSMAGVDIAHVPYKGAGPAVIAAVSGEVTLLFANIVSGLPQAKAGRLRALAVTTLKRSPIAPEIPTVAESGLPGYEFVTWFGVLLPAGTPSAVVLRLNREFKQAVATPEIRAALLADGAEPQETTPEGFAQIVKTDIQRYAKLAKQVGMTVD
jgi:tripartite-type tricarboxylate transporter receptor subunit TctC